MEGFCMKLAKLLAVAVNLVAFVAAGVGLGFGIFALVDGQAVAKLFEHVSGGDFTLHVFGVAAVLVVAASSVLLITSFSGCCGAYLESRCLLITNCVLVGILALAIVAVPILIKTTDVLQEIKTPLEESLETYNPNPTTESEKILKESWDDLHNEFSCCGVDGYTDWTQNPNFPTNSTQYKVPSSCCNADHNIGKNDTEKCLTEPQTFSQNLPGCWPKLEQSIENHEDDIVIVSCAVIGALVADFALSVILSCGIRRERQWYA